MAMRTATPSELSRFGGRWPTFVRSSSRWSRAWTGCSRRSSRPAEGQRTFGRSTAAGCAAGEARVTRATESRRTAQRRMWISNTSEELRRAVVTVAGRDVNWLREIPDLSANEATRSAGSGQRPMRTDRPWSRMSATDRVQPNARNRRAGATRRFPRISSNWTPRVQMDPISHLLTSTAQSRS